MTTMSYSEQRQRVYFQAARAMYAIAAQVLDDVREDAEFRNAGTMEWVKNVSAVTMRKGHELEELGHAECMAESRACSANDRAKDAHSRALDAFLERKAASLQRLEDARRRHPLAGGAL